MDFKLKFPINTLEQPVNIRRPLLMMGSCFAEEIGERLKKHRFNVTVNPHGILFNPISIFKAVERYISKYEYRDTDLTECNGIWHCYEHHGSFSSQEKSLALQNIQDSLKSGHMALKNADQLVLTFGSAWAYRLKETGEIVANCHKVPQNQFNKELLTVRSIMEEFEKLYPKLMDFNPALKILMTVSPVKYLRDGLTGNNLSKSMLLLSVNFLKEAYPNISYFPAYEIVNDELRDYRFYEKDFAHPNQLAIDYVWERFEDTCIDTESKAILKDLKALLAADEHRILQPGTEGEKRFKEDLKKRWEEFKKKYPGI